MTDPANKLTAARHELVADLADIGVPVAASWPNAVAPPCGFVVPPMGGEYLRAGPNFGEYTLSLSLVLLVEHGTVGEALVSLEDLIAYAVANTAGNWVLANVDPPAPTVVSESGAEYLGAVIQLSKYIRL